MKMHLLYLQVLIMILIFCVIDHLMASTKVTRFTQHTELLESYIYDTTHYSENVLEQMKLFAKKVG